MSTTIVHSHLEPMARKDLDKAVYRLLEKHASDADIQEAVHIGVMIASKIRVLFRKMQPYDLALHLNVRVIDEADEKGIVGGVKVLAAYEEPASIRIFHDTIQSIELQSASLGINMAFQDIRNLGIIHELFHHVKKLYSIQTPLPEVSAHAFTKYLMDLEWIPAIIFYLDNPEVLRLLKECLPGE